MPARVLPSPSAPPILSLLMVRPIRHSNPASSRCLAGGTLVQLPSDSYRLAWARGESATVTDEDNFFNWSVSLGPDDMAASVQGLLGDVGDTASGSAPSSPAAQRQTAWSTS